MNESMFIYWCTKRSHILRRVATIRGLLYSSNFQECLPKATQESPISTIKDQHANERDINRVEEIILLGLSGGRVSV